ncbi:hypothetical protein ACF0H5_018696 [Mactra antiquata]
MKVLVLLGFLGCVVCNPQASLTDVLAAVIADTDTDGDGLISAAEFRTELLAKFDSDVPSDEVVSKTDFVNSWTKLYNDNHHDAALFFDNLDTFLPFGQLSEIDLLFHMGLLDPNDFTLRLTMKVLLLLGVLGVVVCNQVTLNQVANLVVADTDTNLDGVISVEEFKTELLSKWANDPNAVSVTQQQFVHQWSQYYGDNHADATLFFRALDSFIPFGVLTEVDLLFHMNALDPDRDGTVTTDEFHAFIINTHPCKAHGHFHC